jgi:hypothetical protein
VKRKKRSISDKERLTTLLGVIRGGNYSVFASWTNLDGKWCAVQIKTRRDINNCIAAIRASRASRKESK